MEEIRKKADKDVKELGKSMGDFVPDTLECIRKHHPSMASMIRKMDQVMVNDGALDRKTKRLIALACVAVRMCDDCVYAQGRVAKNYGATKEEIIEAMHVAVLTGGVPAWSTAKHGIEKLFSEWDD